SSRAARAQPEEARGNECSRRVDGTERNGRVGRTLAVPRRSPLMPRPAAPLLAAIDRAFDTCGDRYSCAATLREAIVAARVAAFEGLSRPGGGIRTAAVHAGVVDHLVRRAYAFVARYAGADRDPSRLGASVVAIGDYGR